MHQHNFTSSFTICGGERVQSLMGFFVRKLMFLCFLQVEINLLPGYSKLPEGRAAMK